MIFNQGENESPLHFDNLTIGYRKGRREVVVASGLTATLERGKLICLLGRNGTGKSTLLRTLAGLQPPLNPQLSTLNSQLSKRQSTRILRSSSLISMYRPTVSGCCFIGNSTTSIRMSSWRHTAPVSSTASVLYHQRVRS